MPDFNPSIQITSEEYHRAVSAYTDWAGPAAMSRHYEPEAAQDKLAELFHRTTPFTNERAIDLANDICLEFHDETSGLDRLTYVLGATCAKLVTDSCLSARNRSDFIGTSHRLLVACLSNERKWGFPRKSEARRTLYTHVVLAAQDLLNRVVEPTWTDSSGFERYVHTERQAILALEAIEWQKRLVKPPRQLLKAQEKLQQGFHLPTVENPLQDKK